MRLKKGDKIVIIAGADKGKLATIRKINTKSETAMLDGEGLSKIKKHLKPSQANPDGGIVQKDKPIHLSNIMMQDPKTKKPTRVGYKEVTKKVKKLDVTETVRYAKKSGEVIE